MVTSSPSSTLSSLLLSPSLFLSLAQFKVLLLCHAQHFNLLKYCFHPVPMGPFTVLTAKKHLFLSNLRRKVPKMLLVNDLGEEKLLLCCSLGPITNSCMALGKKIPLSLQS